MADEEILEESAPAPKKRGGGGGFSIIHVAVILVITIGCAVGIILKLSGNNAALEKKLDKATTEIIDASRGGGTLQELQRLEPCIEGEKSNSRIYPLSGTPIIINLADGEHYLSAEFSVCMDEEKDGKPVEEENFTLKYKDVILHVLNEILSTKSYSDFFPAGAEEEAAPAEDEISEFEDQGSNSFVKSKDELRRDIIQALGNRAPQVPIKDIYIKSFLVQ